MFESAATYAGLPPSRPPSSLYCSHRSVSRISAAARNLRIAMSPSVGPADCALADEAASAENGTAAAPTTAACFKNERRPTTRRQSACSSSSWGDPSDDASGCKSCTVIQFFLCEMGGLTTTNGSTSASRRDPPPSTPDVGEPDRRIRPERVQLIKAGAGCFGRYMHKTPASAHSFPNVFDVHCDGRAQPVARVTLGRLGSRHDGGPGSASSWTTETTSNAAA